MKKLLFGALLTLVTCQGVFAQTATPLVAGQPARGVIAACGTLEDAVKLQLLVSAGDPADTTAYLKAQDNTCTVGPAMFIPVARAGVPVKDPDGHEWIIASVMIPGGRTLFMVTTSSFDKPS